MCNICATNVQHSRVRVGVLRWLGISPNFVVTVKYQGRKVHCGTCIFNGIFLVIAQNGFAFLHRDSFTGILDPAYSNKVGQLLESSQEAIFQISPSSDRKLRDAGIGQCLLLQAPR